MSIKVECMCGKVTWVKDELAGRRGKCRLCGRILVVPDEQVAQSNIFSPKSSEQSVDNHEANEGCQEEHGVAQKRNSTSYLLRTLVLVCLASAAFFLAFFLSRPGERPIQVLSLFDSRAEEISLPVREPLLMDNKSPFFDRLLGAPDNNVAEEEDIVMQQDDEEALNDSESNDDDKKREAKRLFSQLNKGYIDREAIQEAIAARESMFPRPPVRQLSPEERAERVLAEAAQDFDQKFADKMYGQAAGGGLYPGFLGFDPIPFIP